MFDKLEILQLSGGLAQHAATRQSVIARNVANANTPGYKTHDIAPFAETVKRNSEGLAMKATRPEHRFSDELEPYRSETTRESSSQPNGNSVSLETELVKGALTRQNHQMAISVYKTSLDIIRSSLGRR